MTGYLLETQVMPISYKLLKEFYYPINQLIVSRAVIYRLKSLYRSSKGRQNCPGPRVLRADVFHGFVDSYNSGVIDEVL